MSNMVPDIDTGENYYDMRNEMLAKGRNVTRRDRNRNDNIEDIVEATPCLEFIIIIINLPVHLGMLLSSQLLCSPLVVAPIQLPLPVEYPVFP